MNYLDTHLGRLQIFNYPFNKGNLQVVQLPGSEAFYIAEFVPAGTFAPPSQLIGALGTPSTQTGAGQNDTASPNAHKVSTEVKTALRNASITVLNLLAIGFSYYTIFHDDTNSFCGGPGQSYYWAVWLFCTAHLVPCVLDFQSSVTPIIQLLTDGHFQYILLGFVGLTSYPTAWPILVFFIVNAWLDSSAAVASLVDSVEGQPTALANHFQRIALNRPSVLNQLAVLESGFWLYMFYLLIFRWNGIIALILYSVWLLLRFKHSAFTKFGMARLEIAMKRSRQPGQAPSLPPMIITVQKVLLEWVNVLP